MTQYLFYCDKEDFKIFKDADGKRFVLTEADFPADIKPLSEAILDSHERTAHITKNPYIHLLVAIFYSDRTAAKILDIVAQKDAASEIEWTEIDIGKLEIGRILHQLINEI